MKPTLIIRALCAFGLACVYLTLIVNDDDGPGRDAFITWFGDAHLKNIDTVGDLMLMP